MSDEDREARLLAATADGDERAFEELVRLVGPDVARFARNYHHTRGDAEDLEQEVWIRVWQKAGTFRRDSSVRTWLYRIVYHAAVDDHRRRTRRPDVVGNVPESWPSPGPSLEDGAAERSRLRWGLRLLSYDHRAAVLLADLEGMPYHRIAQVCGTTEVAARNRVSRGRRQLATLLMNPPDERRAS